MNTTQIAAEAADEITRISKLILLGAKPHTTVQSIIQTAIEKAKMEIWRTAPDQLDVQEAVINKLNLVSAESSAAHASENLVTLTDQYRKGYKAGKKAAHASEQGEAVPSNWCDDLLTGPDGIGKPPYNCIHIEKLLNGIRKRILQT